MTQTLPTHSESFNVTRVRVVLAIGGFMILAFMFADLSLIPQGLKDTYIVSRLGLQLPVVIVFFALSYWRHFKPIYQPALCFVLLWLSFVNYGFTVICWQQVGFVFPYEGVLMYAFFGFFAMRLSFRFAIYFVTINTVAFYFIVQLYPIYGERSWVNLGFVFGAQLVGLVGLYDLKRKISSLNEANSRLKSLSEIDQLTGIYNRRYYENKSKDLFSWCKRAGDTLAVFMVDIDHFKDFNDGYGHQKGDETIALQAKILQQIFKRDWDLVARYGGEEFVIVAPQLTSDQAQHQAERIIAAWQKKAVEHTHGNGTGLVSCSIGIFCGVPSQTQNIEAFVDHADQALYQAKADGRARFCITTNP
ncbi:diguanylate cyclase [Aliikangiella marina]|uniref:diguanylate cyclase n=1 Tax=Aliikangiella marina TaxID=1712262 RepID=A0A545T559_9GAMM|nr:diguanylate cyclase [Aliikangiella marina]TQV72325.1 diguanylate cyclase [Aliikangiella marina]